jgi:hypothetical protein
MAYLRKSNWTELQPVPVNDIEVEPGRRIPSSEAVERIASSMREIGLQTPLTVRPRITDGRYRLVLVTGAHRLAAAKALGWSKIDCFIADNTDDENAELWEIDENLIRSELDAAEHARLTKRRAEIIEARAREQASLSPVGTGTNAKGRKDTKGIRDAASVRDQAEKTGESKTKVARSKKRAEMLGDDTLRRVTGTPLGTGAQLDALMRQDAGKREELIKRAEAGEDVSAVRILAADANPATEPDVDDTVQSKLLEEEIAESEEEEDLDLENYRELAEAMAEGKPDDVAANIVFELGPQKAKKIMRALEKRLAAIKKDCVACNGTGITQRQITTLCSMPQGPQCRIPCNCSPEYQHSFKEKGYVQFQLISM